MLAKVWSMAVEYRQLAVVLTHSQWRQFILDDRRRARDTGAKVGLGFRKRRVFRQETLRRRSLFCWWPIFNAAFNPFASEAFKWFILNLGRVGGWFLTRTTLKYKKKWTPQHNRLWIDSFLFTRLCLAVTKTNGTGGDCRKKYSESTWRLTKDNPSTPDWPLPSSLHSAHTSAPASLLLSPLSEWFVWGTHGRNPSLRRARRWAQASWYQWLGRCTDHPGRPLWFSASERCPPGVTRLRRSSRLSKAEIGGGA